MTEELGADSQCWSLSIDGPILPYVPRVGFTQHYSPAQVSVTLMCTCRLEIIQTWLHLLRYLLVHHDSMAIWLGTFIVFWRIPATEEITLWTSILVVLIKSAASPVFTDPEMCNFCLTAVLGHFFYTDGTFFEKKKKVPSAKKKKKSKTTFSFSSVIFSTTNLFSPSAVESISDHAADFHRTPLEWF